VINQRTTKEKEKMVSQIIQLGSAAEHLKDIMRLAIVGKNDTENAEASKKVINYIELNFETNLKYLLKLMHADKNKESTTSLDNVDTIETMYDTSKLEVRAQNFKKFRESTKILMQ
jgi:hypothetical protein